MIVELPLPQPAKWFRGLYCWCGHPRFEHVDDGPCADVWEWPGVGLVSCDCQAMRLVKVVDE